MQTPLIFAPLRPLTIIARLTLREAVRRRIVMAAGLLGLAFLLIYNLGFFFLFRDIRASGGLGQTLARNEFFNFIFMAGMYAVNFLGIVMAALIAADTLAGEIGSGVIQALVTKPLRRAEVVLGKWLGFVILLTLYLTLMGGGVFVSLWAQAGYRAPHVLTGLALIYFNSLLMLSVTLACSSILSTLATGGVVFGLYSLAFIGGWVEQFGTLAHNQTAVQIGVISSLLIPSEALWKRAASEMTTPLVRELGFSPFTSNSVPSVAMLIYAGFYLVAALWLAIRRFRARDL